ncbi:MAG: hypothetical protein P8X74_18250 [Reinekea sp.]|jgi:HemY protein
MKRMILWIFLFALLLILSGTLAHMMATDPGVAMISWNGFRVDTTFWVAVGIVLLAFVVVLIIIFSIILARHRSSRSAKKETLIALNSWLVGDDDRALKALTRVARAGGSEQLPEAVSLALGLSHGDWMDRYESFSKKYPKMKRFAQSLLAERFWQLQNYSDFIALMRAEKGLHEIVWLKERYWDSLLAEGEIIDLISQVNNSNNLSPEARQQWYSKAVESLLHRLGSDELDLQQVIKSLPKAQRKQPQFVSLEIHQLMQNGKQDAAFKRIKNMLSEGYFANAELLLDLDIENSQKLNYLETLKPSQPDANFCRTIGVLSIRQQLWGNAQSWLEKGWAQGDRTCGLRLAELYEQRNLNQQATKLYRQLATNQFPAVE